MVAAIDNLGDNLVIIHGVRTDCFDKDALRKADHANVYLYYRDHALTFDENQQIRRELNKIAEPLFYILPDELCYNSLDDKYEETIDYIMESIGFKPIEVNYFISYYEHG